MDVSRLLEVLEDIESEFSGGHQKLLQAVLQAYTSARDTPAQDASPQIAAANTALNEFLDRSVTNDYPPSKRQILNAIGGGNLFGRAADSALRARLNSLGLLGVAAMVTAVTEFNAETDRFRKACLQTRTGLRTLRVEAHEVEPDTCEVGVLIPEKITDGKLTGLNKELDRWNRILRGFSELAGEEEKEVTVTGLASGSDEVYLSTSVLAGGLLVYAIDKIIKWYRDILEIQRLRKEIAAKGVPATEIAAIVDHEKHSLNQLITSLVKDLMKQSSKTIKPDRKNEAETHLTFSIKHIVRFIDKDGAVEVTPGIPDLPEEPAEPKEDADPAAVDDGAAADLRKQYLAAKALYEKALSANGIAIELSRKGAAVASLPARATPMLQITDGDLDAEEDADQRGKKGSK